MAGIVRQHKGRMNEAIVALQVASGRLDQHDKERAWLLGNRDAAILEASRAGVTYADLRYFTGLKTDVSIRAAIKRAEEREKQESGEDEGDRA